MHENKKDNDIVRKGDSRFPFRRLVVPALFVAALFAVTVFRGRPASDSETVVWTFSGPTMGTAYTVKVVAPDLSEVAKEEIHQAIRHAVDSVDEAMSTFKADSEISRFNSGGVEEFSMSKDLAAVVEVAYRVFEASGGAFDPTVGPLVDAWGFGPDGRMTPPSAGVLEELNAIVGLSNLEINLDRGTLKKSVPGVRIDLSAIAKGFGVDQVVEALLALGYSNAMVEVGGEVRTIGLAADGSPWRIGIERPDAKGRVVAEAVELQGLAMATSGDYRNFYLFEGRRISHTIDPRTGRPIDHDLASVSVVAETCMVADAWATALSVLGPVEGPALAEELGLAVLFITRVEDGFEERTTRTFPNRLGA